MRKTYKMNCALCEKRSKSTDKESARRLKWICRYCMKGIIKHREKVLRIIR